MRNYLQGRRTPKTQAVCLELLPLCSIFSKFPLPTRTVQAYLTFSVHKLLTFPGLKSASFPVVLGDFGCDVFCQACRENSLSHSVRGSSGNSDSANWPGYEAQKCKTRSRLPELQKFCFKHQRCSKVTQVF